jgi:hypothetical protein
MSGRPGHRRDGVGCQFYTLDRVITGVGEIQKTSVTPDAGRHYGASLGRIVLVIADSGG